MLWTPGNSFGWSVDNYGATYTDTGLGTNSPGHANANTKGANTAMLSGLAEDCYGMSISFSGQSATTVARRCMTDILIDPAAGVGVGGSSWSVLINNLFAMGPTFGTSGAFGYHYYFPIYLKAGTAIGTAHMNGTAGTLPLRVAIRCYGKPSRPDILRCGSLVQTLNAATASTGGTNAFTPGSSAKGSYSASLGTLTRDSWFWQLGVGTTDTSMTAAGYLCDVAANATNKIMCLENVMYTVIGTIEQASKSAFGTNNPYQDISAGQDVYARAACSGTPDSNMFPIVYALGG
jgi:hypothetical protein